MSAPALLDEKIWLADGEFRMGSDDDLPEERPAHRATVGGFWIDREPVTNRRFTRFVHATGYVTTAERPPDPALYRGVDPTLLVPGSAVFVPTRAPVDLTEPTWWEFRPGACWSAPEGPGTTLDGREDHPVVHVSQADARAYARWAGDALPTEAEWEYAARGGLDGARYAWGDHARPGGVPAANTWSGGPFPVRSDGAIHGTTAVGAYPANGYGLLDMIGNVWEWTADPYSPGHRDLSCCGSAVADPLAVGGSLFVAKGGSFLCADEYCTRYRPAARIPQAIDASAANLGFRCVRR